MAEEVFKEALFGSPEAAPEPQQADIPAPSPEQPAPSPEQAPPPATPAEPASAAPPEPKPEHAVPLPKYLDERDRRKHAEQKLAEFEQSRQQPAPKAPDPIDDPEGYAAFHEQRFEQRLTAQRFEMSDVMARQAHGAETVDQALNWATERAQADPVFAAQYMREAHPIDWIVRQHKRDAIVSALPSDVSSLDELIEREVAKRLQNAPTPAPAGGTQPAAPAAAAPSKSLVDVPSSGGVGTVPLGLAAAVESVFQR